MKRKIMKKTLVISIISMFLMTSFVGLSVSRMETQALKNNELDQTSNNLAAKLQSKGIFKNDFTLIIKNNGLASVPYQKLTCKITFKGISETQHIDYNAGNFNLGENFYDVDLPKNYNIGRVKLKLTIHFANGVAYPCYEPEFFHFFGWFSNFPFENLDI